MIQEIKDNIQKSIDCKKQFLENEDNIRKIEEVCKEIINAIKNKNKVCVCGNGGSAADAQHFVAELVGRYLINRQAIPAIAFTTDTSILTSVANDFGYDEIFKRQTEALVNKGDILIGITTSGNSKNIELAMIEAKKRGAKVVGLLGKTGGVCKDLCDIPIVVTSNRTPNIQECHITIIHIICEIVEKELYEK